MSSTQQLHERWDQLGEELRRVGPMRPGSICQQILKSRPKAGGAVRRRGPYTIYTRKVRGKTLTRSLRGAQQEALYRGQIENFRRFEQLTREMVEVGRQLADLEARGRAKEGKKNSRN